MRRSLFTVIVAFALLFSVPLKGDDLLYERFGEYVESLRVAAKIPGLSAAIIGRSGIEWERAFGKQDIERSIVTRVDTPFHVDGVTQLFSAALVLRCVEEARLSLEDRVEQFQSPSSEPSATIGQLLTHSVETPGGLIFTYRPERLEPLRPAVRFCKDGSFRKTLMNLFDERGMADSVPGPDAPVLAPPAEGVPSPAQAERYARTLTRVATPYAVDNQGRATPTQYSATTLTPFTGVITTVRDFARFDLALKTGLLVRTTTLTEAWLPPVGANRQRLPHGSGWFVQSYNGVPVVWQFGAGETGSSALTIMLPAQQLTLVLLANSTGLVKGSVPPLTAGDVTASPFGKVFLGIFGAVAR
jgi:CubicO group peptidase (beta-lactamase class C family)